MRLHIPLTLPILGTFLLAGCTKNEQGTSASPSSSSAAHDALPATAKQPAPPSDARAAAPPAFHDIAGAWLEPDQAALIADGQSIQRFEANGLRTATYRAPGPGRFSRQAGVTRVIVWEGTRESVRLDTHLRPLSECTLPEGAVRFAELGHERQLLRRGGTLMLLDPRSCVARPLLSVPSGLVLDAAEPKVVASPNGKRLAVVRRFCDTADVYDVDTMKRIATDTRGNASASVFGCDLVDVRDDGRVTWKSIVPCQGTFAIILEKGKALMEADGNTLELRDDIEDTSSLLCPHMATESGSLAGGKTAALSRLVSPLDLDGQRTMQRPRDGVPGAALITVATKAVVIHWPATHGTIDYASVPTVEELR